MINVRTKMCKTCNKKQPIYNYPKEKKGLYCNSEWCNTRVLNKYKGYCLFCFINLFPDEKVSRNYKTKEKSVSDFILENFPNFTWICDKQIQDGCSKKRPDLLLDLGYQVIIIEIDENQHYNYN